MIYIYHVVKESYLLSYKSHTSSYLLPGLTIKEVKQLLKDTAWRRVKAAWREKAERSSKLEMTRKLMDNECKARCVGMDCKRRRRMMAKLRGGTAELGIEIGRWHGLRIEDRVCKECGSGEVEDTEHFVMRCAYEVKERKRLENLMSSRVKGWHELGENEKVLRIMDRACCDEAVARAVESLWKKRFVADVPIPHQT